MRGLEGCAGVRLSSCQSSAQRPTMNSLYFIRIETVLNLSSNQKKFQFSFKKGNGRQITNLVLCIVHFMDVRVLRDCCLSGSNLFDVNWHH